MITDWIRALALGATFPLGGGGAAARPQGSVRDHRKPQEDRTPDRRDLGHHDRLLRERRN